MKRTKLLSIILLLVWLMLTAESCGGPSAPATRPMATINNDLEGGKVTFTHTIPGEQFQLITEFSTGDPVAYWHITEPKNITMKAWITPNAGIDMEVLVEHVHADAFIMADASGWDGIITDSMDDNIHGGMQPGFWVTSTYPYEEVFSIQGFSKQMYESWTVFLTSYMAVTDTHSYPMTERNLIREGDTRGQKFQIVWDLTIRYPGETLYHTISVVDQFAVPVDQNPGQGTSDIWGNFTQFTPTP